MKTVGDKAKVARIIERVFKHHDALYDTRIYFSNRCWNYDSDGKKTILKDIRGSTYTRYANDQTITVTTEGPACDYMNWGGGIGKGNWAFVDGLDEAMKPTGYYWEMGNTWNFALYEV